jgi:hypothetical protein
VLRVHNRPNLATGRLMSRWRDARPTLSCPPAPTRTQSTQRLTGARAAAETNTALGAKPPARSYDGAEPWNGVWGEHRGCRARGQPMRRCGWSRANGSRSTACGLWCAVHGSRPTAHVLALMAGRRRTCVGPTGPGAPPNSPGLTDGRRRLDWRAWFTITDAGLVRSSSR